MKKVISLILTMVLLVSALSVSVFATETEEETYLYKDEFIEGYIGDYEYEDGYYFYKEVYYHHIDENDPESDIDWVLVNASNNMVLPWLVKGVIGDIVFYDYNQNCPFSFNWAVYDVANNYFSELSEAVFRTYKDLEQVCEEIGVGQPVGDADFDGKLTISDATYIQRVIAKLVEFKEQDDIMEFYPLYGDLDYVSDMNRDGERNIMDATAIQRKLAKFDDTYTNTDEV